MTPFQSKIKSFFKAKKGISLLVVLVAIATYWIVDPFKVTDPSDPRFDPDKFSFRDYGGKGELPLSETLEKLFPPGTPKNFIDRVLVEAGGVKEYGCLARHNWCSYFYPSYMQDWKGGARMSFLLDDENNLICWGSEDGCEDKIRERMQKIDDEIRSERRE